MAETLTNPSLHGAQPEATPQHTPQAEAKGFRGDARQVGEHAFSFINISAEISLTADDIRRKRENMDSANSRYGGIIERQTASDVVSMALESDLILDYRRDAQRAGYLNVDAMPPELRRQIVEATVRNRADDIIAELESHHPDWTREQLAEASALRISDIITLLSMSADQRDGYREALFAYRDAQGDIAALETKIETMRHARREHLRGIGKVAIRAVNAARDVANNISARVSVTSMTLRQKVGEWYQKRSPEGKRATVFTAAGLAVAGIATYMSMRYAAGYEGGSRSPSLDLVNSTTPIDGNGEAIAVAAPEIGPFVGGKAPDLGSFVGGAAPDLGPAIGGEVPDLGSFIGGEAPDLGSAIGNPDAAGNVVPPIHEFVGGDLRGAKTTGELFGSGTVTLWPETVEVSAWDSQTKDGSLWGISEEMLQRSGVKHPSNAQIDKLVDALRPQADAQGHVQEGQTLNLRPAIDLLPSLT